jgi:hypothetical protein
MEAIHEVVAWWAVLGNPAFASLCLVCYANLASFPYLFICYFIVFYVCERKKRDANTWSLSLLVEHYYWRAKRAGLRLRCSCWYTSRGGVFLLY